MNPYREQEPKYARIMNTSGMHVVIEDLGILLKPGDSADVRMQDVKSSNDVKRLSAWLQVADIHIPSKIPTLWKPPSPQETATEFFDKIEVEKLRKHVRDLEERQKQLLEIIESLKAQKTESPKVEEPGKEEFKVDPEFKSFKKVKK